MFADAAAIFLDFHMNSKTAMRQARPIPASSMTKTPPTLARLSSLAFALLSSSYKGQFLLGLVTD